MAISVKGDSGDPMVEPNVIPLVDIMLVLLIIFIITIPVMTHAVKIDLPRDNPPATPPEVVRIFVEFDGSVYWNGSPIDSATLRDYVAIENARDPQPEIHVDAHRRVPYVYVANVLFTLQRGGLQKVGFVSGEGAPVPAPPAP
jgi:biopolymer transport protein ExbD